MSPVVQRLLELERQKAAVKKYFQDLSEATEALAKEVGIGGFFQDPSDGTVFKVVVPDGRWVNYETISYVRTRRSDEKRGDLSLKEAQAAGFTVPGKD
jgi:hypothetical protein